MEVRIDRERLEGNLVKRAEGLDINPHATRLHASPSRRQCVVYDARVGIEVDLVRREIVEACWYARNACRSW